GTFSSIALPPHSSRPSKRFSLPAVMVLQETAMTKMIGDPTATNRDNVKTIPGIRGRKAIVTGGARGIGRAVVQSPLREGANVAFTYCRSKAEASALVEEHPERASCHALSLQDPRSIAACFEEIQRRWGRVDIVVNNAAVGSATVKHYEPDPTRWDEAI